MAAVSRRLLFASPVEPSGASWLINCLLALGVRVDHKPVVDKVWRNAQPPLPASHMWRADEGGYTLNPKAAELRKWLPALERPSPFTFRDDVYVHYVQDVARAEDDAADAVLFVRDPRDALYSMYKRRPREQSFTEFLSFPHPLTLLDRVDQWALQVSSWLRHPQVHVYRFEDYKQDASALLRRILADLAIDANADAQARAVAASTYERAREAEQRYREAHPGDFEVANRAGRVGERWSDPDKQELVTRVQAQAPELLHALGYGESLAPLQPPLTLHTMAGFTGTPVLRRLGLDEQMALSAAITQRVSPEAQAKADERLVGFASTVHRDTLQRSGLPAADIRQLIDRLCIYFGDERGHLVDHLRTLRGDFVEGADYHWQKVRELLAHRRRARPQQDTLPAQANAAAGVLRGAGDGTAPLYSPDALLERAQTQTGHSLSTLEDYDPLPLQRLCAALQDSPLTLTFFGRARAEHAIVNALSKRLRLQHYLRQHPEIERETLHSPLVIVSPFRTGTTFAHRLLAADPGARWTRSWEVFLPPPADPERRHDPRYLTDDARIDATRRYNQGLARRHPRLVALHGTDPGIAEECFGLLETSLLSHSFLLLGAGEPYLAFIDGEAQPSQWQAAYARYVKQLQLLQWWWPAEHWLLKSPFHLWHLGTLARALPTARFVQLHREPADVALSFCELLRASYGAIAKPFDPKWLGAFARRVLADGVRRGVDARRSLASQRFLHLRYEDLIAAPLDCASQLRHFAGWEDAARANSAMEAWLRAGTSRASPAERPTLDYYGLRKEDIDEDFAPYQAFCP